MRSKFVGAIAWGAVIVTVWGCSSEGAAGGGSGGTSSGGSSNGGREAGGSNGGREAGGSGGSTGNGGSGGSTGNGGSGGSTGNGGSGGDAGPFVPPRCANPNETLPPDAPALTPGVWKAINGALPFQSSPILVQGMTIDPCNAATLYVCVGENPLTGYGGVWRSTDAGTSWSKLGPMTDPNHVRVDPRDPLHLYVTDGVNGSTMGFWVTTDGGSSWELPSEFNRLADELHNHRDVYHVAVDPTDFDHLLLSFHSDWSTTGKSAGIFESFDGGKTFRVIPVDASGAGYGVFFLYEPGLGVGNGRTWLYAPQAEGLWRTADAGASWTRVTDIPMTHGGGQLYYAPDGTLYFGAASGIIKSSDNGISWSRTPDTNAHIGIIGDGTRLYASMFNRDAPYASAPLATGATEWTEFGGQVAHGGSFEMAFDEANRIIYSATLWDGVVALKLGN